MSVELELFWKNKEVLVTGGSGFIGSHLVDELLNLGAMTTALVHYNSRNNWGHLEKYKSKKIKNLDVKIGDIRDIHFTKELASNSEYIYHLAALIGIPYSYTSPNEYISTNIQGTSNLLQSVNERKLVKFIGTSTSEVYGSALYTPIDEDHPLQGQSPYSASKIGADMILQSYSKSYNIPTVLLRPFNTYGPRQSARAIIPTIISQALIKKVINVGNLETFRDFTFVKDTVYAFLGLGISEFNKSEIFNCASGCCINIEQLIEKIGNQLDKVLIANQEQKRVRPKNSEVTKLMGNSSKIKKEINWTPKIDFDKGLDITIEYIKNNLTDYSDDSYIL